MLTSLALRVFALSGLLFTACSQAPSSAEAPGGGTNAGGAAGVVGSAASAATASAGLADSGAGGADTDVLAPSATLLTEVRWKVLVESTDPNIFASAPAAASREHDAAVAYVERTYQAEAASEPPIARVVMQRFDATGERLGSLIELGSDPDSASGVTLASDGKRYAACWNTAPMPTARTTFPAQVHCALFDEQGEVQPSSLALAGRSPTIVSTAQGWVVAYASTDTELRVQPLTAALAVGGTPVDLPLSSGLSYSKAGPLFASTPSGFALVGARLEDGHDALTRLDLDLQPTAAIPLEHDFWFFGQLVATDTRAAVSLSAPYGSYILLFDETRVTAELPIAGGGKTGVDQALSLTEGGIAAAWLGPDLAVWLRFFADGQDEAVGLGGHGEEGSLLGSPVEGGDSYQQTLEVAGQTLLVARGIRYGYLPNEAIRVAPLTSR
ncbi:MAG TPA: hypothetical protein VER12_11285 [Polyangiaceae bacterium]|nr:hypothetical protein [Polyangiaceae bacterium]